MEAWKEELYLAHHGIKGQKWGIRRFQNEDGSLTPKGQKRYDIQEAKTKYKQAKKDYKKTLKVERAKLSLAGKYGFGVKGIKERQDAEKRVDKKGMAVIDSKAALAKAKGGEKAEFKAYRKAMQVSGIRGSGADVQYNNRSTKIYNHLMVKKGKEYADRVEKKVQNVAVGTLIGSAAVSVGMMAVSAYLETRS